LTHEITIVVNNLEGFGAMTDRILSEGDGFVTLTDFVWKAVDVVSHLI
jgi:hypothetical protein